MHNILFDSDLLGDDLLALSLMAKDPEVKLLGVTAYGRRVCALERCKAADSFLAEEGITGVTFVPGSSHPLVMEPRQGCRYCDGILDPLGASWSGTSGNLIDTSISGVDFLVRMARTYPHEIELLCTGPLTNIALALSIEPTFATLVKSITLMGGTWKESGNSSAVAEANIFNDPEAAKIVFDRFPQVTFVPLDVTMQVCVGKHQVESMPPSSVKGIILSCCESHRIRGEEEIMPLHDVLAYMVLKDPSIVTLQPCDVQVETRSKLARGMLVLTLSPHGRHFAALAVDFERAESWFLSAIRKNAK